MGLVLNQAKDLCDVVPVERDGLHGLYGTQSVGCFSHHATLNSLIKADVGISRLAFNAGTAWAVPT